MSAVPKLRFPEFDGEWLETNIGSCGSFYYGKSAPKWSVSEDAPTPCIRYGELYTKFGATVDKIYSRTNIDREKLRFSKGGEVLVPRVGEDPRDFAKCTMLPFSGVAIGEMISVFETDQNSLFFTYYFNTMKNQFAKMVAGGNPSNLYYENLKPLPIWRPSLPEQQKIASFLSSVDKKIDLLRQKKDALELYKKGLMQKIFSQEIRFKQDDGSDFPDWEEVALGEVVEVNSDKRKVPNKFHYIDLESVKGGVLTAPQEIFSSDAPSRAQRVLSRGDILFQLVRPYQMNNLFFDCDGHFVASTGYAQLRSENNRFLFYLVHYEEFVAEVLKRSTGSNYPAINSNDLKTIQVSIPAIKEQEKIADFLSALDARIQNTSSQIDQMETFKKGLLQQMFV